MVLRRRGVPIRLCLRRVRRDGSVGRQRWLSVEPQHKGLPDCAEEVKAAARICRFCGYDFDKGASKRASMPRQTRARSSVAPTSGVVTAVQYPSTVEADRLRADTARMIAAGYVVKREGDDGQGSYNVFFKRGPAWQPDLGLAVAAEITAGASRLGTGPAQSSSAVSPPPVQVPGDETLALLEKTSRGWTKAFTYAVNDNAAGHRAVAHAREIAAQHGFVDTPVAGAPLGKVQVQFAKGHATES